MNYRPIMSEEEISMSFKQTRNQKEPGIICGTDEQQLSPMSLNANLSCFNNTVWEHWADQKIRAIGLQICCVKDSANYPNIILRGTNNKLWQAPKNTDLSWTQWHWPINLSQQQNANIMSFFAARFGGNGQIVLFVRGADNSIWEHWASRENISSDDWVFESRKVCTDRDFFAIERHYGGLEAFLIGFDNQVWHSWTMDYDQDKWSQWESLGGCVAGGLYLQNNSEKYPELFAKDPMNMLWHIRHYRNGWHDWKKIGGPVSGNVSAAINTNGGLDVYCIGYDRKIYRISRPELNSEWEPCECLGGNFSEMVGVEKDNNGKNKLCAIGIDQRLWEVDEENGFADRGGCLASARITTDADGRVIVIGIALDGNVFARYL